MPLLLHIKTILLAIIILGAHVHDNVLYTDHIRTIWKCRGAVTWYVRKNSKSSTSVIGHVMLHATFF